MIIYFLIKGWTRRNRLKVIFHFPPGFLPLLKITSINYSYSYLSFFSPQRKDFFLYLKWSFWIMQVPSNNASAQYKQYSICSLNSENNVLFIHIVLQINSSVSGEEGGSQLPKSLVFGLFIQMSQTRHIVSGIFCLFIHPQTLLHD